ncbi:glutathione-disulfide reductase [Actibacterium sp. XHP0104]|uniref:glutathione-disulfide reductase n=1 Tax=Actibacterium sp. XHP0104 TaxID=2984335 RepID=UPI0021E6F870|nr:glutathione-disulfide reductase [Actibacterium sp. XHP0104]MCV2882584.1 glutathione-disulfide reductase [Actibacterium sp. XHP0104]
MSFDYDLFVIGGGSGGVRAARLASSEAGAKVALAEEYRMGGTCVIRGCVPKKLMVFASGYTPAFEDARAYGWDVTSGAFDWSRFKTNLHAELTRLEGIYTRNLGNAGVEIFHTRAVVKDAHTVELANGQVFTAKHILVATGGRPFVPEFPGSDLAVTSNEMFLLDALPKKMLIVGGGFIACEFACIMNGLGVDVTQFYRGAQVLRGFDDEARGHVADQMTSGGVNLHVGTDVVSMKKTPDGIAVKSTTGHDDTYDVVMYATGRNPNTDGLGLAEAGVKLGRKGEVVVDDYSQTSVPSIYAVGDVTDRINLTPVAIREGAAFVETVFHGRPTKPDHDLVASAVFTQPELGTVGLTEEEAREREPIEVYSAAFRPMQTLFAGREDRVLMKLIVSRETRKVLGCHIVAPNAGEMIQLAAIAIKMGATKEDFDRTVAVHPTMSEELVTMKTPTRVA